MFYFGNQTYQLFLRRISSRASPFSCSLGLSGLVASACPSLVHGVPSPQTSSRASSIIIICTSHSSLRANKRTPAGRTNTSFTLVSSFSAVRRLQIKKSPSFSCTSHNPVARRRQIVLYPLETTSVPQRFDQWVPAQVGVLCPRAPNKLRWMTAIIQCRE